MAMNYKETQIEGTKWTRCHTVVCNNPLNSSTSKSIIFHEETAINVNNASISLGDSGTITVRYDHNGNFPIIDPATGGTTGQIMSHQELYKILFSLYMHSATQRDANTVQL